jgi:hypothetical protein
MARVVSFTLRLLYPQGRAPGTNWIGGWVGTGAGLDGLVIEPWSLIVPLYRIHCSGSQIEKRVEEIGEYTLPKSI